jgi:hypothetical protein
VDVLGQVAGGAQPGAMPVVPCATDSTASGPVGRLAGGEHGAAGHGWDAVAQGGGVQDPPWHSAAEIDPPGMKR